MIGFARQQTLAAAPAGCAWSLDGRLQAPVDWRSGPVRQAEQFQNGASEISGIWGILDLQSQQPTIISESELFSANLPVI